MLALIIITCGGWKLVKTVTAFTISHSITLTAATLGFVHVPQRPVEAVIALSIVFVAAEILHGRQGREGITVRAPWVVALTFGLLHGLGFAGGLSAAGLPQGHVPLALLFFSLGVETGHLLFVSAVLAMMVLARRMNLPTPAVGTTSSPLRHRQCGSVLGDAARHGILRMRTERTERATASDFTVGVRPGRGVALAC